MTAFAFVIVYLFGIGCILKELLQRGNDNDNKYYYYYSQCAATLALIGRLKIKRNVP